MGFPSYNVEQLLKEIEVYDEIKSKLEEHSVDDETFWGLNEEQYEKVLEIKGFGKRKRLFTRKQELEETHKKKFDEEEKKKQKQKYQLKVIKMKS